MQQTTLHDAALHYAAHNLPVFPLKPRTKVPLEKGGFHNATTDSVQIQTWWNANPDCNIGLPAGDVSGIVVIDIDGRDGEQAFTELEQELGPLPDTVTQITPGKIVNGRHVGKGRQLFFKADGTDYRCQTGIAQNIDIRGNGGYVVVPPSIHPDHPSDATGKYHFAEGLSFDDMEPVELPAAWSEWILGSQSGKRIKVPTEHDLPPASEAIVEACRRAVTKTKPAIEREGGDKQTFTVACLIFHDYGLSEEEGRAIMDEYNQRCMPPWSEEELQHKIDSAIAHTGDKQRGWRRYAKPIEGEYHGPFGAFVLDPARTQPIALAFRWDQCRHDEGFTLMYYSGNFYSWAGNCYQLVPTEEIKGAVLDWMTRAVVLRNKKPVSFPANKRVVNDVFEALKTICFIDGGVKSGAWIGAADEIPTDTQPLFAQNCVYDWWTGEKHPCSPRWFNLSCVNADIAEDVPEPTRWLQFLDEIWGDDQASKDLLHEFMGLCLTLDTSFQKILILIGPTRSGKGTLLRLMRIILGPESVATPTTASLTQNFGLQQLLDKPLATISDARFTGKDIQVIIERLLNITGEDAVVVDVKYRDPRSVKLPTRIIVASNEMPRFPDNTGAVASRCLPLLFNRSFIGREDRGLDEALANETDGILALMIDGLRRLHLQGFSQPAYHDSFIQDMEELGSPLRAFIRQHCVLGAGKKVHCHDLWQAWKKWCEEHDLAYGTASLFGRNLKSCYPEITKGKSGGMRCYVGIELPGYSVMKYCKRVAAGKTQAEDSDEEALDEAG